MKTLSKCLQIYTGAEDRNEAYELEPLNDAGVSVPNIA
jgi:hypothetical protein